MSSKIKGYDLERRVVNKFKELGYYAKRNIQASFKYKHAVQFPDVIVIPPITSEKRPMFIECKVGKYLSKEEKAKFKELEQYGDVYVCWREKIKNRINLVFGQPEDYKEIFRLI